MMSKGISKGFFILILFIVTAAFLDVLGPYYSSVLWAVILAVIFHPVKKKLKQYVGERNGVVSLLTVALICLIVFTPLAIIASSLAMEFNVIYTKLQTNNSQLPTMLADFMRHLPGWAQRFLAEHNLNSAAEIQKQLSEVALKGGQYLAGSVFLIGKGTFNFVVGFGVMLYLLFFLLKDGPYLVNLALEALPLSQHVKHHLFVKFAAVSRAPSRARWWSPWCKARSAGWRLLYRHRRQPAVGRADGIPVDHPGRGLRHHLGAGGDLLLRHRHAVERHLPSGVLRGGDRPGGQHPAPAAGGQRHQNAGLPDPDLHPGRHGDLRHQRLRHRPLDRRAVHRLLEHPVRPRQRGEHRRDRRRIYRGRQNHPDAVE